MPALPTPDTEPAPVRIHPPCPGCPDPENAREVDIPCGGPEEIEMQAPGVEIPQNMQRTIGKPACSKLVYCPRTRGTRIE